MNLKRFASIHPDLLPGLVNTALRNDCDDLDDLARTHDIDRGELERRMEELGFRYVRESNQFRACAPEREAGESGN